MRQCTALVLMDDACVARSSCESASAHSDDESGDGLTAREAALDASGSCSPGTSPSREWAIDEPRDAGAVIAYALADGTVQHASAYGVALALNALGALGGPPSAARELARGKLAHVPHARYPAPGACAALACLARSCVCALIALAGDPTPDAARYLDTVDEAPNVITVCAVLIGAPETPGDPEPGKYILALERAFALFFIHRHVGWSAPQRAAMTEPLARIALVYAVDAPPLLPRTLCVNAPVHAYLHAVFGRALAGACACVCVHDAGRVRGKCLACRALGAVRAYDATGVAESRVLACSLCGALRSARRPAGSSTRRHRTDERSRALALVHPYAPASRAAASAHAAQPPPAAVFSNAGHTAAGRAEAAHATVADEHALALLSETLATLRKRVLRTAPAEARGALAAVLPSRLDVALLCAALGAPRLTPSN